MICVLGRARDKADDDDSADVSLAVLWSINDCTRPDQSCAGFQAANGNGNLIVGAVNIQW
jgi:hypothetical protein